MNIQHTREDKIYIVSVDGNIAGNNDVIQLKQYLDARIQDAGIGALIIDCSQVNYVDSSGLGMLVNIFKRLKQKQARLALTNLNKTILNVLKVAHLDKILPVYVTQQEALNICRVHVNSMN